MEDVKDYTFKQSNSVAQVQALEDTRVANAKESLIKKIIGKVKELLQSVYGPSVEASLNDEHLTEIDRTAGHFLGTVAIKACVPSEEGTKAVVCPVQVDKETISMPDRELLVSRIEQAQGEVDAEMDEKLKAIKEKVNAIKEKAKMDKEISDRVEGGEDLDKVTSEVLNGPVEKKAEEYEYSDGQGGVIDRSISEVPLTWHVNKSMLPASIKKDDIVNVTGYRYKVMSSSPALSEGKDDGSQWILSLVVPTGAI